MNIKKILVLVLCFLIFVTVYHFYRMKMITSLLSDYEVENSSLDSELASLQSKIISIEERYNKLDEEFMEQNYKYRAYEALNDRYQYFLINQLENFSNSNISKIKVNGLNLGDDISKVVKIWGENYTESIGIDDAHGKYTHIYWKYQDGTQITLDPIFVSGIIYQNPKYSSNLGVQIGDLAFDAISNCDGLYKKFTSPHTNKDLVGWYIVDNEFILILHFAMEGGRYQNNIAIDSETKVQKIEIVKLNILD
ncbi:hypothetical protein [Alkaliphilus serpentinus]|uniref:Uncharacterized protein n=1 Tax=Alkaliphilus serpentinus TaxID=1482731 RepID=A0A833MF46_9FIRM|nr:hypothetical protein [Alkaliphilus serpentinus]KAB3532800.1 hypothetical protein F8153_01665 [Alkaliphilus serpentinus]